MAHPEVAAAAVQTISPIALLLPVLSFLMAATGTWLHTRATLKNVDLSGLMDQPNDRSLHQAPVPRIGGYLMMVSAGVGFVVAATALFSTGSWSMTTTMGAMPIAVLGLGAACLTMLGRRDDQQPMAVLPRLAVHLLCASLINVAVVYAGSSVPNPATLPMPSNGLALLAVILLGTLTVTWFTNLYNFMDGANGLAGLMALIGFATYAVMAPMGSLPNLLAAAVAGAALGFLFFNWDPARIFMGDAGSIPLGYLAAGLGFVGAGAGYWPWFTPIGVFFPFVFDATTTLALRAWRGEQLSSAHRQHAYQRAVVAGLGHRRTVLVYGLLMAMCSVVSATSAYLKGSVSVALWTVILLLHIGLAITTRLPFWPAQPNKPGT